MFLFNDLNLNDTRNTCKEVLQVFISNNSTVFTCFVYCQFPFTVTSKLSGASAISAHHRIYQSKENRAESTRGPVVSVILISQSPLKTKKVFFWLPSLREKVKHVST